MRETVFLGWLFKCRFLVVKISRLIPGPKDASRPKASIARVRAYPLAYVTDLQLPHAPTAIMSNLESRPGSLQDEAMQWQ
jgi:hypothetical protein